MYKKILLKNIVKELGIILAIVILTFFTIKEIRAQIDDINLNIFKTNEITSTRAFYKETYEKYNKDIQDIINANQVILRALPPTEDIREFMGILNTYGAKHSVEINVNAGPAQIDTIAIGDVRLQTIPVSISISGAFQNIRDYIKDIESLPYFFTITNLEEHSIDATSKNRGIVISAKLWTKPEQDLTKMQSQ